MVPATMSASAEMCDFAPQNGFACYFCNLNQSLARFSGRRAGAFAEAKDELDYPIATFLLISRRYIRALSEALCQNLQCFLRWVRHAEHNCSRLATKRQHFAGSRLRAIGAPRVHQPTPLFQ
jgi:hypothetical protein